MTGAIHYTINIIFPPSELGKVDEFDEFGTFAPGEKTPFGLLVLSPVDEESNEEADNQNKSTEANTHVKSLD